MLNHPCYTCEHETRLHISQLSGSADEEIEDGVPLLLLPLPCFTEDQITELLRIAAQSGGETDTTREWLAKTDKTYQQALALFKRHAADKAAKEKLDAASNDATEILTQTFDATNLPAEPAVA